MSKRKYDEINSPESITNGTISRALRLQRLQLDGVLDQTKKSIFRSLKVARGFERQKLGRRQKTAKTESNATETVRLEAEVAALKSLDLASTAEIHLYKSLLKIKSIASAPAFPHYVQAAIDASKKPQQSASANVHARLFKSGPVQAAMTEALNGIRAALGIEELKSNSKKRLRAKDYANGNQASDTSKPMLPNIEEAPTSEPQAQDGEERIGRSSPESPENRENNHIQDDEEEDIDYDVYASRLAESSDEESGGEDVNGQNHDRDKLDDMSITEQEDLHEGEAEEESPEENAPAQDPTTHHPTPTSTKPPTALPPTSTTFLPSLSLSGYWSGSESAPSYTSDNDNDSSAAAAGKTQARKNRRGQQARRALWEKKFGQNANHVKKRARDQDRDWGWDARKGARGVDGDSGKKGRGRGRRHAGSTGGKGRFAKGMTSTGANSDPVGTRRKAKPMSTSAAEGPLHPSWEAARKAKEQKKAVPFQGKKVVF